MRTRFARLVMIAMLTLPLLGGSVVQALTRTGTIVASSTMVAPNGDKITTFYFSDGTVMVVVVKAAAYQSQSQ